MCIQIVPLTKKKMLNHEGHKHWAKRLRRTEKVEEAKMTSCSEILTFTRLRRNTNSVSLTISESRSSPPWSDFPSDIVINQRRRLRQYDGDETIRRRLEKNSTRRRRETTVWVLGWSQRCLCFSIYILVPVVIDISMETLFTFFWLWSL